VVESADECLLQYVFCFLTRPHATLQEGQKPGVVLQQHRQHLGCLRITLGPAVSSRAERHALVYSHPQPQLQLPSPQGQSAPQVQPLQPQVHSWLKSLDSLIVRSSWVVSQEVKVFIPANAPRVGLLHMGPLITGATSTKQGCDHEKCVRPSYQLLHVHSPPQQFHATGTPASSQVQALQQLCRVPCCPPRLAHRTNCRVHRCYPPRLSR
jgi:hypothetical protein